MFWGLLFVCLNLNFHMYINALPNIDFLPDFIGYGLLLSGVSGLSSHSPRLEKMTGILVFCLAVSAAEFVLSLMGQLGFIITLLSVVVGIMRLYILYQVAKAYEEIPSIVQQGARMRKCWKMQWYLLLIMLLATWALGYMVIVSNVDGIGTTELTLVGIVVIWGFLLAMLYYDISYIVAGYRAIAAYAPDEVMGIEQENGEYPYDT